MRESPVRASIYVLISAVTAILLCSGCTKRLTAPDELVLGIASQPLTLDPRYATDAYGMRIDHLIFNSLTRIGPHLEVAPDAARSWTYKNGVYTLQLTPGLKFHNGRPVTPEDLQFSFEQYSSKSSPFASSFDEVGQFDAFKEGDHLVVRIKMKKFVADFLGADLPVLKILPKMETSEFPQKLVGTGSFRFVSKTDSEIVLAAVKEHAIATPLIPNVVIKVVHDDFTRFQKLMKGELDAVLNDLAPDKVRAFENKPAEFNVYRFPSASMSYLLVNMKDPALSNLKLKKALSQALNRPEIVKYKLEGLGEEATSILTKQHPYFNSELKNPPYDPAAAKKAVQELGFEGHKLAFKSSSTPSAVDNSRVIAYEFSRAGLDVDIQSFEWGKFYDDVKKGNFQLAIMKWVGVSDPDIYRSAFHSQEKPPSGRNRGGYENKELDPLLEQAVTAENEAQRRNLYLKIQKIVFDDYAIIPLWYEMQVAVTRKNVRGFEPSIPGDYDTLIKMSKSVQVPISSNGP